MTVLTHELRLQPAAETSRAWKCSPLNKKLVKNFDEVKPEFYYVQHNIMLGIFAVSILSACIMKYSFLTQNLRDLILTGNVDAARQLSRLFNFIVVPDVNQNNLIPWLQIDDLVIGKVNFAITSTGHVDRRCCM